MEIDSIFIFFSQVIGINSGFFLVPSLLKSTLRIRERSRLYFSNDPLDNPHQIAEHLIINYFIQPERKSDRKKILIFLKLFWETHKWENWIFGNGFLNYYISFSIIFILSESAENLNGNRSKKMIKFYYDLGRISFPFISFEGEFQSSFSEQIFQIFFSPFLI